MANYERVCLIVKEVFVYKIPPRASNQAVRATDWGLSNPSFTGRLRVTSHNQQMFIKIEDQMSGSLFAQSVINEWPTKALEPVSDSSRYFVLRLTAPDGRHAYVGIGFADRGDSFDLNVTLQENFKQMQAEKEQEQMNQNPQIDNTPKLDLGFKSGQTIKINIGNKIGKKDDATTSTKKQPAANISLTGFLPPPPNKSSVKQTQNNTSPSNQQKPSDDFGDFGSSDKSWVQF